MAEAQLDRTNDDRPLMQHGLINARSRIHGLTLDGVVQLLLLLMLQRELLPLLLNVLLQCLELLAHDAVLTLEPQACLQAHITHTCKCSINQQPVGRQPS
jgi:hypothetical protein